MKTMPTEKASKRILVRFLRVQHPPLDAEEAQLTAALAVAGQGNSPPRFSTHSVAIRGQGSAVVLEGHLQTEESRAFVVVRLHVIGGGGGGGGGRKTFAVAAVGPIKNLA